MATVQSGMPQETQKLPPTATHNHLYIMINSHCIYYYRILDNYVFTPFYFRIPLSLAWPDPLRAGAY